MNKQYACEDADASLRYLLSNFYDIMDSGVIFSSDSEEKALIKEYMLMPDFENSCKVYVNEYFISNKLFNCLELNSTGKGLKQIFDDLNKVGDVSVYIMEQAFRELIKPNRRISESLGLNIFLFCYVTELLNRNFPSQ